MRAAAARLAALPPTNSHANGLTEAPLVPLPLCPCCAQLRPGLPPCGCRHHRARSWCRQRPCGGRLDAPRAHAPGGGSGIAEGEKGGERGREPRRGGGREEGWGGGREEGGGGCGGRDAGQHSAQGVRCHRGVRRPQPTPPPYWGRCQRQGVGGGEGWGATAASSTAATRGAGREHRSVGMAKGGEVGGNHLLLVLQDIKAIECAKQTGLSITHAIPCVLF